MIYRRGESERVTNKRRTPARLPRQLLGHARRWERNGSTWAVEWRGQRIADLKTGWSALVLDTKLDWKPTPHSLKHTTITWAIQNGASIIDAAGFFTTSTTTIERTYWHLSPHFQSGALAAIEAKQGRVNRQISPSPCFIGAPERIRTSGLCLRRAALYPAELRVPVGVYNHVILCPQRQSEMGQDPLHFAIFPEQAREFGRYMATTCTDWRSTAAVRWANAAWYPVSS